MPNCNAKNIHLLKIFPWLNWILVSFISSVGQNILISFRIIEDMLTDQILEL